VEKMNGKNNSNSLREVRIRYFNLHFNKISGYDDEKKVIATFYVAEKEKKKLYREFLASRLGTIFPLEIFGIRSS